MGLYFEKILIFDPDMENVDQGVDRVRLLLQCLKLKGKDISAACLKVEDLLTLLKERAAKDSKITIRVKKLLGTVSLRLSCQGEQFSISDMDDMLLDNVDDPEARGILTGLLKKVLTCKVSVSYKNGVNICKVIVSTPVNRALYFVLGSLVMGLVTGFLMKTFLSSTLNQLIICNIFEPVVTIFMNLMKTVVGPLVFFSVAGSISGFSDLSSLGRIAFKTLFLYTMTSVLALVTGIMAFRILPAGDSSLQGLVRVSGQVAQTVGNTEMSFADGIIKIFPSNFLAPFLKMDMVQIIVMAVLVGIACTKIVEKDGFFGHLLISCNNMVAEVLNIIVSFMPVMVFCSMAQMIVAQAGNSFLGIFLWVACTYLAYAMMLVIYAMMLICFARYNPLKFFKKFMPAIITSFTTSSSNATIPVSMKQVQDELGVDPKIASFSIPLGATINMDGTCLIMMITGLSAARIFEIPLTFELCLSMCMTIFILSVGTPGIAGGFLVFLTAVMSLIGVPAETVSIFFALFPLVDKGGTVLNVCSDATVAMIVARSEKLLHPVK